MRIFINQLEDWPGPVRIIIIRQAVVKGKHGSMRLCLDFRILILVGRIEICRC